MALNCFCRIEKIEGECSQDPVKDKKYFEVVAYEHNIGTDAAGSHGGTSSLVLGRPDHSPFKVKKRLDKASPKIAALCSAGQNVGEILIEGYKNLGDKKMLLYIQYKLTKAVVAAVEVVAGDGPADLPSEEVYFRYEQIDWKYTQYDNEGKSQGDVTGWYNLSANTWG